MCYSSCFVHATQRAFVQRQLLQCRTCGSQAFNVLDCCRNPDYARLPTSRLGEKLKRGLGAVHARLWAPLFRLRQRTVEPTIPAALDEWEARPLILGPAAEVAEAVEHETVSTHR